MLYVSMRDMLYVSMRDIRLLYKMNEDALRDYVVYMSPICLPQKSPQIHLCSVLQCVAVYCSATFTRIHLWGLHSCHFAGYTSNIIYISILYVSLRDIYLLHDERRYFAAFTSPIRLPYVSYTSPIRLQRYSAAYMSPIRLLYVSYTSSIRLSYVTYTMNEDAVRHKCLL